MKLLTDIPVFMVLLACIFLSACEKNGIYAHQEPKREFTGTVYDYLQSNEDVFKDVLFILEKSGLDEILKSEQDLTFFAPTDQNLINAMQSYNVFRKVRGLPSRLLDDIDSTSWRYILLPYLVNQQLHPEAFARQTGVRINTMATRAMYGQLIKNNASGVQELGNELVRWSYPNGSIYSKDWISSDVSTSDIQTENGVVYVLENNHSLGFNYFIDKAERMQNSYSDNIVFSGGTYTNARNDNIIWKDKVKELKAIDANTVELPVSDLSNSENGMWLTVLPNDSVKVEAAPWSSNQTIEGIGSCHFDPDHIEFILNYQMEEGSGKTVITETLSYVAKSATSD